ncbi:MAG: ACT domain-containing protein [Christensenellales bacterium]
MKAIVSVIGKDKKGIIAKVATKLSDMDVNIEDISQTIMQNFFTMIMAVDLSESKYNFEQVKQQLVETGQALGVEIHIQSQSIFESMHQLTNTTL